MENLSKSNKRVVVTGMGFALPGVNKGLCTTKEEFWDIISNAKICIDNDGLFYGFIKESDDQLRQRITKVSEKYKKNYVQVHLLGLISLEKACEDAGLEIGEDNFENTAVLTARQSISSCYECYQEFMKLDPINSTPEESMKMFKNVMLSATMTDVANVQAAMLKCGGSVFAISCGCASSGVLIGIAEKMIKNGEVDSVIVTGADNVIESTVYRYQELVDIAEHTGKKSSFSNVAPATKLLTNKLMQPYDENSCGFNAGVGSATIILESEERAKSRGAHIYGEIINQSTARTPSSSAVTIDETGSSLVRAIKGSIDGYVSIDDIEYINGGAQGDKVLNIMEANALTTVFNNRAKDMIVTSQEACFGHDTSVLGVSGVAATLLMMQKDKVCPTAGCVTKASYCPFNPVPGNKSIEHKFDYALSFNYQAGSMCSSILLGRY